jgi:hypothetical protein
MSATMKPRRFDAVGDVRHVVPIDPGAVEHVLHRLRQEFDPELIREAIRVDPERRRFRRDLAARLRSDLESLVHEQPMSSWLKPRDKSDWAMLASDPKTPKLISACAGAWCSLLWLERAADRQAMRAPDPDEPTVLEWHDDWRRLRSELLEIGFHLASLELLDESEHAAVGAKFSSGRKRGAIADHNRWLESFILANPEKTATELRDKIRLLAGTEACPFERDGDDDIRADDWSKPVNLLELIKTRRKRMNKDKKGQKR